jgi:hypothetical protein
MPDYLNMPEVGCGHDKEGFGIGNSLINLK